MFKQLAFIVLTLFPVWMCSQSIGEQISNTYERLGVADKKEEIKYLNTLSLLLCRDSTEKAVFLSKKAVLLSNSTPEKEKANISRQYLAIAYLCSGLSDSALQVLESITNDDNQALTKLLKGISYEKLGETPEAISQYLETTKMESKAGELQTIAFARIQLVRLARQELSEIEIDGLLIESYKDLITSGNHFMSAFLFKSLGEQFLECGNLPFASLSLYHALKKSYDYDDKHVRSETLILLAQLFERINENEVALDYYKEAYTSEDLTGFEHHAIIQNGIARLMIQQGNHRKALYSFQKSFLYAGKRDQYYQSANSLIGMSEAFLKNGDLINASRSIILAWPYTKLNPSGVLKTKLYLNLAKIFIASKNNILAEQAFLQAKNLAELNKLPCILADILPELNDFYIKEGNNSKAKTVHSQWKIIQDSLFRLEKIMKVEDIDLKINKSMNAHLLDQFKSIESRLSNELKKYKTTNDVLIYFILLFAATLLFIFIRRPILFALITRKHKGTKKPYPKIRDTQTRFPASSSNKEIGIFKSDDSRILKKLSEMIELDKIYLDPELTLRKLAINLSTNTTYLSKLINQKYQQNFNSFINKYRIQESIRLIEHPENANLTLEALSERAGFKSKSSFNSFFKKYTGYTPTAYLYKKESSKSINFQ